MKIKLTPEEIVKAKFQKTLSQIHGYIIETTGSITLGNGYTAKGVNSRFVNLETIFLEELKQLEKDIEI